MTRALAVLTLAAGLAVLVHAPAGSSSAAQPVPHVHVQNAALLHVAGGHLWWVGNSCAPTRYALKSGRLTVSAKRYCLIWPSPDGRFIAAAQNGAVQVFDRESGHVATIDTGQVSTLAWTS